MIDMGKFWYLALLSLSLFSSVIASSNTYDYIVVGSGPGGGTLAANLAKAGQSVLLLEAGDDQGSNPNEEIAGWFFKAFSDPLMRWDFFVKLHSDDAITAQYEHLTWETTDGQFYVGTDPPAGAKLLGVYYPRAGTLGGCSTHNALIAALPSHSDWDYIAQITGDASWKHNNMQQYFAQLEHDHVVPPGTPGHGFSGPLDITVNGPQYLQNQTNAFKVLQATAQSFGQNPANLSNILTYSDLNNNNANHDQQVGIFGCPAHRTVDGRRVSSRTLVVNIWNATNADGSKKYPNFDVRLHSFATKILFNTNGAVPRAIGVEYLAGESMYNADPRHNYTANPGVKTQVFARKEVIVAGGTFNSPQLLMLSGVGSKADLKALDISVVVDLPGVGTNLQDNTEMGVSAEASQDFTSIGPPCTFGATPDDPCLPLWEVGQGPYIQGPLGAVMFKSSQAALNERDFMMFPLSAGSFNGYWPAETVNVVPGPAQSNFDFSMVKIHTQSRGTVKLASNNPRDTPLINFQFFEGAGADADLQAYVDAVQWGRGVFDSLNSTLGPWTETLPCQGNRSCDVKAFVKAQAWSHHATSSCAIGSDNNPLAVLDSKFRVRGTKGLRVVDASAFPRTPGAFPVLPTFVLGMKGSAAVLADANSW